MTQNTLLTAIDSAVRNAIKEIGVDAFKRTSFFMSNEPRQNEQRKAA